MANIFTNEVLVLNSAVIRIDTGLTQRSGIEVQNLGPNDIYVAVGESAACVLTKSRKVSVGEAWSFACLSQVAVYAKAATADQVTGAATIVTELQ
jgi:hypothetical protein